MYYIVNELLSKNRLFNFALGARGCGKTFALKELVIKHFKKSKRQFVWVRRYKKEFDDRSLFFDDIRFLFPDDSLTVKGHIAYINDEIAGYFITLTTANYKKSTPFPLVDYIVFDEFIIDKNNVRYLKNEAESFMELYSTIARTRTVKAIFIANAISIVNPFFTFLNVKPNIDKRFTLYDEVCIEFCDNVEYKENVNKTRFAKVISGTKYGDYAINNKFLRDNDSFIEKRKGTCDYLGCFIYNNMYYGYWIDYANNKLFVDNDYNPNSPNTFSLTNDDHNINTLLISSLKNTRFTRIIRSAFENGLMRFNTQQAKQDFFEYFTHIR